MSFKNAMNAAIDQAEKDAKVKRNYIVQIILYDTSYEDASKICDEAGKATGLEFTIDEAKIEQELDYDPNEP